MQGSAAKRITKIYYKCGRRLLTQALDGFYYFEDDEIEDKINQAELKYSLQGRKAIRSYIWSHPNIRSKISDIAFDMFEPFKDYI